MSKLSPSTSYSHRDLWVDLGSGQTPLRTQLVTGCILMPRKWVLMFQRREGFLATSECHETLTSGGQVSPHRWEAALPPPSEADTWPATHTYPRTQQGRLPSVHSRPACPDPCSCPLIKKPEAVLEPTFIVLLLRSGTAAVTLLGDIYIYTYVHTPPHLQQRLT